MSKSKLTPLFIAFLVTLIGTASRAQAFESRYPTVPAAEAVKIKSAASNQARTWMDELNGLAEKTGKTLSGDAKATAFDVLFQRAEHLEVLKHLSQEQISPQVLWIKSEDKKSLSEALKGISESSGQINALYIKDTVIEGDDSMDAFAEQMGKILAASEGKNILIFDHVEGSIEMMEEFVRVLKDVTENNVTSIIVNQENQLETLNPLIQNMVQVLDLEKADCEKILVPAL